NRPTSASKRARISSGVDFLTRILSGFQLDVELDPDFVFYADGSSGDPNRLDAEIRLLELRTSGEMAGLLVYGYRHGARLPVQRQRTGHLPRLRSQWLDGGGSEGDLRIALHVQAIGT